MKKPRLFLSISAVAVAASLALGGVSNDAYARGLSGSHSSGMGSGHSSFNSSGTRKNGLPILKPGKHKHKHKHCKHKHSCKPIIGKDPAPGPIYFR
jgi:hypothetical protein